MVFLVHFPQLLVRHVRIDLRGGDVFVAEHGLDASDVGAVFKEVGGETVAQGVRVDVFDDAGLGGAVANDALYCARGEAQGWCFYMQSCFMADKKCFVDVGAFVEVGANGTLGGVGDKNEADFVALASYAHFATRGVDLCAVERDKFGNAQSGGKQEFQDGTVAKRSQRVAPGRFKKTLCFLSREKFYRAFGEFGNGEFFRREGGDVAKGEEFEEGSQGDNGVGLRGERERLAISSRATIECFSVVGNGGNGNVFDGLDVFGDKKIAQRMVVVTQCELTPPFFEFEEVEKFLQGLLDMHERSIEHAEGGVQGKSGVEVGRCKRIL